MRKDFIKYKDANFNGILYPTSSKDKIVLVFSGIDGGINYANKVAKFYAKNNIPALATAYFRYKNTPKGVVSIPLEYIINIVNYLKKIGYKQIGIDAFSKGTELALNVTNLINIDFLILRAPSYFNAEGLDAKRKKANKSCWSYNGKELEYSKYTVKEFSIIKEFLKHKEYNMLKLHEYDHLNEKSIIDTTNIKCPVLLLSAKHDTVWPSYNAAIILNNKLSNSKHLSFDYLSHFLLPKTSIKFKLINKSERKNSKKCKIERKLMNQAVIDFIKQIR